MEDRDLRNKIDVILFNQRAEYPRSKIEIHYEYVIDAERASGEKYIHERLFNKASYNNLRDLQVNPDIKYIPKHPNIDLLIKLYYSISKDKKLETNFIIYLSSNISIKYSDLKYFLLEFLVKIGKIDFIIKNWRNINEESSYDKLGSLIYCEFNLFKPKDLEDLLFILELDRKYYNSLESESLSQNELNYLN